MYACDSAGPTPCQLQSKKVFQVLIISMDGRLYQYWWHFHVILMILLQLYLLAID